MTRPATSARAWIWIGAAGAILFLSCLASVLSSEGLVAWDAPVARAIAAPPSWLVSAAKLMHVVGDTLFIGGAVGVAILALLVTRRYWGALRLAVVMGAMEAANLVVKEAVRRPRPTDMLVPETGFAFTSGHSAAAAALATLAVWYALRARRGTPLVVTALVLGALWAITMAFSRLVLHVHVLTDVIGGLGLGMGASGFALAISIRAEKRWPLRAGQPARRDDTVTR